MRRHVRLAVTILVAAFAMSGGVRADDAPATPPLVALAPTYDAGRVEAGTPVRHTYVLRNRGTKPLQVAAKASCGCTTTDYDRIIAPGGTGQVTALLDTRFMRGRAEKIVEVTTNDPAQPVVTLTLIVDSQRALLVEPGDRPVLRGPLHRLPTSVLTVRAPDDSAFRIIRVEDAVELRAAVVPIDGAGKGRHRRYQLTLTPNADLAVGSYTPNVTLVTSLRKAARFALDPTIIVTGPLIAVPTQLRVGPGVTTVAVRITASDGVAFHVLTAEASDPDFTTAFAAVEGEPAFDVTVRYAGKPTRHGPVNAVLKLTTDAPTQPVVLVRLGGKL
jgi:Protein of unknown function (DUF1573)